MQTKIKLGFAEKYYIRVKTFYDKLQFEPLENTEIIIVIPVYNEPQILRTVQSIWNNNFRNFKAEVIFVINSRQNSDHSVIAQNYQTIKELQQFAFDNTKNNLQLNIINLNGITHKPEGVGFARKTGMDEALRQFDLLNKPHGIIVSLDADTIVAQNYINEIYKFFVKNPKICAANIAFEHILSGNDYSEEIFEAARLYELYLRYYVQALRYADFPYAFHTIGSAFAVRAKTYAQHGGMVTNQSGEDFYFLQKIIPSCNFAEIKTTRVFPSPRITDRVIFGTGVAINDIIKKYNFDYPVFVFEAFEILKDFFAQIRNLFYSNGIENLKIDTILKKYLYELKIEQKLTEIRQNTSNEQNFIKRFFFWFNAFRVLKFLNYLHTHFFDKNSVIEESYKLIKKYNTHTIKDTEKMLTFFKSLQNK